ncbi:hypothetical protein BOTU111921_11480 [Bordetella tumbae]|uniref:lysozyme n=1 Tax=Bordetella tumbae TaxID=1649139 RepID=UPI0039F02838
MKIGTKVAGGALALIASGALALFTPDLQQMLSRWEGDGQNVVYPDKLAKNLPTVCRGITKYTSPEPVILGDYWSDEKCLEVEQIVVSEGQIELAKCIKVYVTQPIFDAFSSFGHNVGNANACVSVAMGLLNAGRVAEACDAIAHKVPTKRPNWSVADGKYVPGLYSRRLDERKQCLSGLH